MGLEDFLTAEDKVLALETLRQRTFSELYTLSIRLNIDPDTFEYETWTIPEEDDLNRPYRASLMALARMCETLKIIDSKIGI
jgi:hypothetical protein